MQERLLLSTDQLLVLASPLRYEIIHEIYALGAATVYEVADRLGRDPLLLYYHFRRLSNAGIIVILEQRRSEGRPETVYGPAAKWLSFDRDCADKDYNRAYLRCIEAQFRIARREFAAALESFEPGSFEREALAYTGSNVRIDESDLRELRNRMMAVIDWLESISDRKKPLRMSLSLFVRPVAPQDSCLPQESSSPS